MAKRSAFLLAVGFSIAGLSARAPQTVAAFDVASVKPNRTGDPESASYVQPGGRYVATNVTVRMLMKSAYGLHDNQVIGGPNWINTERFDIAAKAEGFATASEFRDQARVMLRPLLADRFKLVVRREKQEIPVYALVLARPDRTLGPQLRRTDPATCTGPAKEVPTAPGAPEPAPPLICGAEVYAPGHLTARSMALSNFVLNISRWTERVVVDETGLAGRFDWDLQWVPDASTVDSVVPPGITSLAGAVRDQAGFRLEPQRRPVDVLAIERVERPQPD